MWSPGLLYSWDKEGQWCDQQGYNRVRMKWTIMWSPGLLYSWDKEGQWCDQQGYNRVGIRKENNGVSRDIIELG